MYTVDIQIPDVSRIQMVQMCPVVEWFGIQVVQKQDGCQNESPYVLFMNAVHFGSVFKWLNHLNTRVQKVWFLNAFGF